MLALSACSTPYGKMGLMGGVEAMPVSNDTVRISAVGNGYTSQGQIQDFVLLKAAETAIARGQTSFTLLGGQDTSSQSYGQTPGTLRMNNFGGTTFATYNPGFTYNVIKPGQDVLVRVWSPAPGEQLPPNTFNAQEIYTNISPRVQRTKS